METVNVSFLCIQQSILSDTESILLLDCDTFYTLCVFDPLHKEHFLFWRLKNAISLNKNNSWNNLHVCSWSKKNVKPNDLKYFGSR